MEFPKMRNLSREEYDLETQRRQKLSAIRTVNLRDKEKNKEQLLEAKKHYIFRKQEENYKRVLAIVSEYEKKGKKINLDSPGSGTNMTVDVVFGALGIKRSDLALANELKSTEGPTMLQDNHIDGYFFVAGHPTANIKDAANSVDINIVPIEGPAIDALVKKYPYYAKGIISGTYYKGVPNDVPSIGVKAVLVTSSKVKDEVVYQVVKTILDNFDKFKELHPSYKTITKESLLEGLSVPQHPGAIKAFKEAGLLK